MNHVNRLGKVRDVKDSVIGASVNPNLSYAAAYTLHLLPVRRFETILDLEQFMTGFAPGVLREGTHVLK
jgi:hypothetical protein